MSTRRQFLVLVRHGESEANANLKETGDKLYYSACGSDPAVRLTANGQQQAETIGNLLAARFADEDRLEQLYCTDFARVQETTSAIANCFTYPLPRTVDARLTKRSYGNFWNLTRHGVATLFPEEYALYLEQGDLLYRPPEGENYADLFDRVDDFISSELAPSRQNVLIVTSLVVLLSFQRALEGISDQEVLRRYEAISLLNGSTLTYCRHGLKTPWQRC